MTAKKSKSHGRTPAEYPVDSTPDYVYVPNELANAPWAHPKAKITSEIGRTKIVKVNGTTAFMGSAERHGAPDVKKLRVLFYLLAWDRIAHSNECDRLRFATKSEFTRLLGYNQRISKNVRFAREALDYWYETSVEVNGHKYDGILDYYWEGKALIVRLNNRKFVKDLFRRHSNYTYVHLADLPKKCEKERAFNLRILLAAWGGEVTLKPETLCKTLDATWDKRRQKSQRHSRVLGRAASIIGAKVTYSGGRVSVALDQQGLQNRTADPEANSQSETDTKPTPEPEPVEADPDPEPEPDPDPDPEPEPVEAETTSKRRRRPRPETLGKPPEDVEPTESQPKPAEEQPRNRQRKRSKKIEDVAAEHADEILNG